MLSHEEFAALPAAKIFAKKAVCITDWFTGPDQLSMACLSYADKVLFIDEPGVFAEPPSVRGRVEYVGPILREFQYGPEDRGRARAELNIPADAFVVAVLPGSWTEEKVPIFDKVMEAYDALDKPSKFLIWVAGSDHELIGAGLAGRTDALVVPFEPAIERIMVAADLAVTKCNRKTHVELAALGTASVALSLELNPIDHARVLKLATVLAPEELTLNREYPRFAGSIQGRVRPARSIAESCLALMD